MTWSPNVDRRSLLKGSTVAGVAIGVGVVETNASAKVTVAQAAEAKPAAKPVVDHVAESGPVPEHTGPTIVRSGSDFMVDVIKTLGVDYIAANPGSTFRGLQESFLNYGGNTKPEWLTCCHEESSVAMAHGYFKIAGKPMVAMVHGTVGVQHASMAIYNAYADRVPVLIISGNGSDANTRRPPVEWYHSVQDNAAMVRDYTKWDDAPASLQHFAESQIRAMKIATAVPAAPVMITVDMDLQEDELTPQREALLRVPKLALDRPPQGESAAVEETAKLLVAAERPVIVADRYARTPAAMGLLVQLAELLEAPVIDTATRVNFPSSHYLNHSGRRDLIRHADVILALEPEDLWGLTHSLRDVIGKPWESTISATCKVVSIGTGELLIKANYQEFQRYGAADIAMSADPEATLPSLIDAVRRLSPTTKSAAVVARGERLRGEYASAAKATRETAALGWDLSPVHPARLAMEVWEQIKHDDWSLVGSTVATPNIWARRLWPIDKPYSHTGSSGASGVGYGLPAAVGAAIANRDQGRLSINFQSDGDFMYAPGALWTAAHHRIPLLTIMHNNGGYHQELMHLQLMANRHNRGVDRTVIGTTLHSPEIDYAKMAQSMGVYAEGPISDPANLAGAIRRALAVVRQGAPALLDVVSQPR